MPATAMQRLKPVAVQASLAKQITGRHVSRTLFAAISAIIAAVQFVERSALKRRPILVGKTKAAGVLAMIVAAAALLLGRKQPTQCDQPSTQRQRFVQHPLVAWVLENASVVGIATLSCTLIPAPRRGSFLTAFASIIVTSIFQVWSAMGLQSLLVGGVYKDIPFFTDRSTPPLMEYLKDCCRCNLPVDLFNSTMLGFNISALRRHQFHHAWLERRVSPLAVLKKFLVLRICIDVGFWLGHRMLHHRKLYWIHKRHHEHKRPTLQTNFHFAPVDLWVEAAAPAVLGLMVLEALKWPLTRYELALLSTYMLWHESGSHSGKPVPTVTYFPPLAPLYQLFLGPVDLHNVKHHDMHHQHLDGNYGITIWPDIVMGTRLRIPDDVQQLARKP